ncbi:MAG: hypothetical protein N3A61_05760 [Ignavibacteria bacterium]|nr:hypothetical protein [Ignavibacteria bacterium]
MYLKKLTSLIIILSFTLINVFGLGGCSAGLSDDEIAQINALKSEVSSLEKDVKALKDEKSSLERTVGELNAKLEQCAKDKEATKKNLEKLQK